MVATHIHICIWYIYIYTVCVCVCETSFIGPLHWFLVPTDQIGRPSLKVDHGLKASWLVPPCKAWHLTHLKCLVSAENRNVKVGQTGRPDRDDPTLIITYSHFPCEAKKKKNHKLHKKGAGRVGGEVVSSWISTSCKPHRVVSERKGWGGVGNPITI